MTDLLQRFIVFYQQFHVGICKECYMSSSTAVTEQEPAWFSHSQCADAFRYMRSLFVAEIKQSDVEFDLI